jgi:diketogulonate reductase-like aldo/keto reductase
LSETKMSEYIAGFNDGYAYVLEQIERHPRLTNSELLQYLKGEKMEDAPRILPARLKDKQCD